MGGLASLLMVASGCLCILGSISSKSRLTIAASSVMLLAMVDMGYFGALPPVVWSGLLLVIGLCMARTLRPAPAGGDRPAPMSRTAFARSLFPRVGRTSATLSTIAYPIMAWQILNHGAHAAGAGADGHAAHHHGGHSADIALMNLILPAGVIVVVVLLLLCTLQAVMRKRPGLTLDCVGMAVMLTVMQFLH